MLSFMFRSVLALFFMSFPLLGQVLRADPIAKVERIGGQFRIVSIEHLGEKDFRIKFESEPKTGKHDYLVLRSDHLHLAMQEGQVLRLSAEVIRDRGSELEVTQVLLFLPSGQGTVPIWLLSSQHVPQEFRGARWLEMHAPQADYLIL